MNEDTANSKSTTRRAYLKYGSAVVGGGLLAGCTGQSDSGTAETDTSTETTSESGTGSPTETDTSYEVCMEPNGCHTLDTVPEDFLVYHQGPVDMVLSLGQLDGLVAAAFPSTFPTGYFDQLPGISVELDDVTALSEDGTPDKELFYELDVDLHLVGHHPAMEYFEFDETDLAELEENVAPFHGSWMRRPDYTDGHPYYGLYEGLDRYAEVFQTKARGQAFRAIHDDLVGNLTAELPPSEERPSVAYLNTNYWGDGKTVYARDPTVPGYQTKPLRDLGVPEHDAFAGQYPDDSNFIKGDFELLLDVDPEVIVYHAGMNVLRDPEKSFENDILEPLRQDPVAGEVRAIDEGRVYPFHEFEQGPVINLFNTELLSKALYPETFGSPTGMEAPPEEEQLFDRQRVADIIDGDI
ncbi:ABC transporter substrate-binding protein [Haloferax sp. MBLA0076]|uniref:ABC transporter substrate-binding protein n=1 Tax=Haloferax litoreum TaxID=2666140 RepID=A0A6A8GHD3_9EURY|nr:MULTISPECIES: ABC transporter substrate-binding protein [Haloferax]KAB1193779.1 ABC transporter substrate-binding protein [Haloferax sp. CBA1148]MRX22316.1 ABC transporter substrate-binding protein [Haloferax litoreum]